ncbi:DUF881 domain-containing protein [Nocardioides ferulae]|uniref:DUF881 domain-containing protein n=1 Tax=Nocardioides ferulae TaxID=2340821 RepID=UPI0013DDE028|nr:DUF881 domain-containing protein [Nocardioides ferulae]
MAETEQAPRVLPDRVTTPLLTLITQQSLDEDYRHVAARRAAGRAPGTPPAGPPRRGPGRHLMTGAAVALFGLMVALAAVQTSRNADVDAASHRTLVTRIETEREALATQQDRVADLREGNAELQQQLTRLISAEQGAVSRLRRLQVRTGFVATTGEGIVVTVDDPASGDPDLAVRAENLNWLLDGLWLAGAEAIAVNDERVTARSAVTPSGTAIGLNTDPLTPPYVVRAIGNRDTLQARLLETGPGALFFDAAATFGFRTGMQNVESQTLPAAPTAQLQLSATEQGPAVDGGRGPQEDEPS